jgi:hypothetical protein
MAFHKRLEKLVWRQGNETIRRKGKRKDAWIDCKASEDSIRLKNVQRLNSKMLEREQSHKGIGRRAKAGIVQTGGGHTEGDDDSRNICKPPVR